jgi:hypothetical protein
MQANEYFIKYPVLQVRPYGLLAYDRIEWLTSRKKKKSPIITTKNRSKQNNADGTVKGYTGKITPFSKKKLKRAIQLLVASAVWKEAPNFKTGSTFKFKVNFITLTLPSPQGSITDKQLKNECLDNWIKRMRRKYKLKSYVWRAEKQKNGNLHFHIITDVWIRYDHIRNDWNEVLQKFKFIDEFEKKNGHRNPNSTDVHAVWKVKNLTQYFIKYMTKGEKDVQTIEGKLWDCSKNLKTKTNCEMLLESEALNTWQQAQADEECKQINDSNFSIVLMNPVQFDKYVTGNIRKSWEEYIKRIREGVPDDEQPTAQAIAPYGLRSG